MRYVDQGVLERGERIVAEDGERKRAVLRRAALLPEVDRMLIELAMQHVSRRQIASLLKTTPGSVCRRVQRLSRRLHDPVVVALMHEHCPLRPQLRQVGVERRLLGMTLAAVAQKHQLTRQEVKRMLEYVTGWHQGLGAGRKLWERRRIER